MTIFDIKLKIRNNKIIVKNVLGALLVRGGSMLLSLISMPLYMQYFNDNLLLGVWFTLLIVLNWILNFDLGVGNGLRNNLTKALSRGDRTAARAYISSAYILFGLIVSCIALVVIPLSYYISWDDILNISPDIISYKCLREGIIITLCGIIFSFVLRLINPILYALQRAALPNALALVGTLLQILFLVFYKSQNTPGENFIILAWVHVISINVPPLFASMIVFFTSLKDCLPSFRFYSKVSASQIFSLGIIFFILQLLYMVISTTNEAFISHFFSPENVVDYQVYIRLFSIAGSLITLAMVPIWSAVTKAYAERNYMWILKLYRLLNVMAIIFIMMQLLVIPFLQIIVNFWLQDNAIDINYSYALYFALYSAIFIWVGVQSSIVAGLGDLKVQFWCYVFAVIFKIALVVAVAQMTSKWISIIIISILSLLPYCVIQPIYIKRKLNALANV